MLLIITPLGEWRRKIMVYRFVDASEKEIFEALEAVNEMYESRGQRERVNITLVPITPEQLDDWIDNNVSPNWWETFRRRVRYTVTTLVRP